MASPGRKTARDDRGAAGHGKGRFLAVVVLSCFDLLMPSCGETSDGPSKGAGGSVSADAAEASTVDASEERFDERTPDAPTVVDSRADRSVDGAPDVVAGDSLPNDSPVDVRSEAAPDARGAVCAAPPACSLGPSGADSRTSYECSCELRDAPTTYRIECNLTEEECPCLIDGALLENVFFDRTRVFPCDSVAELRLVWDRCFCGGSWQGDG